MSIVVGEVIAVSGVRISLRIFEDSNHETIFFDGVRYRGVSLREHITIQRGFIDIVCLIEGEYLDERKLDTDAEKTLYIRKVDVRPIGYIMDDTFFEGIKFMPMIRDKAYLLSELMVAKIYGAEGVSSFSIGCMLKENVPINLPWTKIFNSHIGIFGNTGSGKSNTLAKLYTTLFSEKIDALKNRSQFVIIDFNGEYTEDQIIPAKEKKITILNNKKAGHKFPIESIHFWDAETLSLLFQATTNTQQPFLRRVLTGRERFKNVSLERFIERTFEKAFSASEPKPDALELSREIARILECEPLQEHLKGIVYNAQKKYFRDAYGNYYNSDSDGFEQHLKPLLDYIDIKNMDQFSELILRCYLQLCSDVVLGYAQYEHIQPVISRAKSSISALRNVLKTVDIPPAPSLLHVISLKKCKNEVKKSCPC
ncbi:helicase HerA domain-containing protein [Pseudomonas sp. S1_G07]